MRELQEAHSLHSDVQSIPERNPVRDQVRESDLQGPGGKVKFSLKEDNRGRKLTEAQQEFFQDSKVVDEDGHLLTMYHGTSNSGFNVFDTFGGRFGLFGIGSYFTADKSVVESYTRKGSGSTPNVYEVYLNVRNPLDMDGVADLTAWRDAFRASGLDETYLNGVSSNEEAFRALKENLADEWYSRDAAEGFPFYIGKCYRLSIESRLVSAYNKEN